jgi:GNAT superfamily N-acetyltransferase
VSSDSGYIVRLYESGDEDGIIELLKTSYSEWRNHEYPLEHWNWKYLENPVGSIVIVADWNGKIVGVMHRILLNIKVNETTSSSYGDDVAVHPDYRRKGIYKNMLNYSENLLLKMKISFRFMIQIHKAAVIMAEREGYTLFPFHISHMIQIRNIGMHFKMRPTKHNLVSRYGFFLLKLLNSITKQIKTPSDIQIENISDFDEKINAFWENTRNEYNFIIEKNMEYLNWRYCSQIRRYCVKLAEKDEEILGFIVLEIDEKDDYSEGYIVDLMVLPGRMDAAKKLISESLLFFKESDVNAVHYRVVKNHSYQTVFRKQGFIELPSKLQLFIKMLNKDKMQLIKNSKPSQIHFNYGDYY